MYHSKVEPSDLNRDMKRYNLNTMEKVSYSGLSFVVMYYDLATVVLHKYSTYVV